MSTSKSEQYEFIAKTIHFLHEHQRKVVHFNDLAKASGLNPDDFEELFQKWVGTEPARFFQSISREHFKSLLKSDNQTSLFGIPKNSESAKFSHVDFISMMPMNEDEFLREDGNLSINYGFYESPFGQMLVASTEKGICRMAFETDEEKALNELKNHYSYADFHAKKSKLHQNALKIFSADITSISPLQLHIKATEFQLKVWNALLKIPFGALTTYSAIATEIGIPQAARAVGTAIGSNPIAYLIPCHRVVQTNGNTGGYMWGNTRKTAILGWEQMKK